MKWRCETCKEIVDPQFDSCWKCGASKPVLTSGAPVPKNKKGLVVLTSDSYPGASLSEIEMLGVVTGEAFAEKPDGKQSTQDTSAKLSSARQTVMASLKESAEALGANAVIGMRLEYHDTANAVLITAVGNAIRVAQETRTTERVSDDVASDMSHVSYGREARELPPRDADRESQIDGPLCPSCGSAKVTSIEVFNRRHPESVKVKSGGCLGCLLTLLLIVILWPVLLALGVGGGVLGALGLGALSELMEEYWPIMIGGVVLMIIIKAVTAAAKPSRVCEQCGHRW